MKNIYINAIFLLGVSGFITSCSVKLPSKNTPESENYGFINRIAVKDGFPVNPEPWVVISDREKNSVFMGKGDEKSPKELKFLEPLLVLKRNSQKGLVKVAEYHSDALLKKIPSKSLKTYGWIPEDQLLLWSNAIKSARNGFAIKAAVVPSHSDVLRHSEKYLKNDSVLVFTSPDLSKTADVKLPVGQLVYIYKKAENQKRYLIGKSPSVKIDSISNHIYGWVSSNMISAWGDRTALRVSPDYQYDELNNLALHKTGATDSTAANYFKLSDSYHRTPMENLISVSPAELDSENGARFFSNALNYDKNFVYNVLGEPLYFNRYKEIINKNKSLNIVFVMDISNENSQNTAVAKSTFQDLQLKINNIKYYKDIQFGAVLYKKNPCGDNVAVSGLSKDFATVSQFIEQHTAFPECNSYGGQPMQQGLAAAGDLLAPFRDETNLVVLVGATAIDGGNISYAVRSLSEARAKLIAYQTLSGSSDMYNNFVLLSENLISSTARNIAELEKERTLDQNLVKNKNNYNLQGDKDGVFYLDYPNSSMSQGFVIFPKKGEINSNALLAKSLDSLISQVTHQNKETDKTLNNYFKSVVGASRTEFRKDFALQFPDAPHHIPVETASNLVAYNNPFIAYGTYDNNFSEYYPAVQKGILISEKEYDQLRKMYEQIYLKTESFSPSFSPRKAIREYLKVLKQYSIAGDDFKKSTFNKNTMAYSVAYTTGFDNSGEELLSKYQLRGWKKTKIVPKEAVNSYFKQYRVLAERLLDNKNSPKIMIEQNGEVFYWLNSYFMPKVTPQEEL